MSKALTIADKPKDLISFDDTQVSLIKRTVAVGASDDELALFLHQCKRTGLDPLARQIYFQKRTARGEAKVTIITGIDGYRLVADRTGNYAGNDDPVFDDEQNPRKATVTVYKVIGGIRCPFTSSARWDQYYPGDAQGFMWRKMPHLMLGKCAEALALRKAFPAELSGMYVQEEMHQAGAPEQHIEATAHVIEVPKVVAPAVTTKPAEKIYHGSQEQQLAVFKVLRSMKVPEEYYEEIHNRLKGHDVNGLKAIVEDVRLGV